MKDCIAQENSWRLSEKFERDCRQKSLLDLENEIGEITLEAQSADNESCLACNFESNHEA